MAKVDLFLYLQLEYERTPGLFPFTMSLFFNAQAKKKEEVFCLMSKLILDNYPFLFLYPF